jgi:mannitol/fructose-specific phosphotransferase system IIA component (Ntr-type)
VVCLARERLLLHFASAITRRQLVWVTLEGFTHDSHSMATTVLDLLTPDLLTLDLRASTAGDAIGAAAPLARNPAVSDFAAFCAAVLAREEISPTAVGYGVAFPHARVNHVRQIVIAAGRSSEGIAFAGSLQRVHLILVIGTPLDMVREYLALLGGLAKLLKNIRVRERLMDAATADEFLAALRPSSEG